MEDPLATDEAADIGEKDDLSADVDEVAMYDRARLLEKERAIHEAKVLAKATVFMDRLYAAEFPTAQAGQQLSRKERTDNHFTSPSLADTEIDLASFHRVFTKLHRFGWADSNEGRFLDIGSGIGKAVFAACLFHTNWKSCVGIEILTSLNQASLHIKNTAWHEAKRDLEQHQQDIDVQFLLGDALTMKWSENDHAGGGDVVFINATSFDEGMVDKLSQEARGLRSGAFIIITSKRLRGVDSFFDLLASDLMENSFGAVKVFIYKRGALPAPGFIGDYDKYVKDLLSHA